MTTATKERSDAGKLADVADTLTEVRKRLATVSAACRAVEGPEQCEGLYYIVWGLKMEVAQAEELVTTVLVRLRKQKEVDRNGDSSPAAEEEPQRASVTYSGDRMRRLLEAMAVGQGIIGLASDDEYFNTWDKKALKAAYKLLDPFTEELRAQAGIDDAALSAVARRYLTAHSEGPEEGAS